ncbi:protein ABCl7chloroplastic-like [Trifolium pratense]|uniref:Protein ABCl7chloroplastic-like n=1 Tax=Trifolium pratense TaxID=57577 RepID=A0A2K3MNL4_TRIPR|nr:protein ABCl7chloroplastic-like [Trifolium pratense]PNY13494.1 protein ABCl7chloroplastic-like [Trifolium pratense]PNY17732.1 protein ABCl7chloroplastic-like [Trifolium pratense]
MSGIALTPTAFNPIIPSSSSSSSSLKSHKFIKTRTKLTQFNNNAISISSDPFLLNLAETLEDSIPTPQPLQNLREASSESLLSTPWPSRRDEPFRFTDLSFLRSSHILPAPIPTTTTTTVTPPFSDDDDQFPCHISFIDGHFINSMSKNLEFPDGVYVGSLLNLSGKVAERVLELVSGLDGGDLFWSINGMAAPDLMVVYVPEGVRVENPVHLGYLSLLGSKDGSKDLYISNPRVLVVVEKGGEVDIVEEFSNDEENENEFYWSNAVLEVVIGEGGKVRHSYIQTQSLLAAHIKWTSVRQESSSTYELTEVSTGGKLGRHNLHIKQLGPDTVTELSTLHLSVGNQTQDLHSSLVLDHPRGFSRQLHKCIVTHSQGQAVFDGNVKVNRYAQQTDAGQLTRSLLLEPRATVNVKPNLQIIADDVKCSHGAAISDLEQSQLLYFQARGIDSATARRVLIFAFGGEVIDKFPYSSVRDRVRSQIKSLLDPSPKLAPL